MSCCLFALLAVTACGEQQQYEYLLAEAEAAPASEYAELAEPQARECSWTCQACDEGEGCEQTCTEVGDCGSTCSVVANCVSGYSWDDASCSCVAD